MDEWDDADQIDVDDSDLPSLLSLPRLLTPANNNNTRSSDNPIPSHFLHRCTSSQSALLASNSNPPASPSRLRVPESKSAGPPRPAAARRPRRRIPGPAGEVQARMQRELLAAEWHEERGMGGNKVTDRDDEGAGGSRAGGEEFETEPWISAMDFLGRRDGGCSRSYPISSIRAAADKNAYRVEQVVGIVSSCKPNGLGGLYATLKDPTGTIGTFVHSRALESTCFRDLAVGCVVVLKQVVVFCGRSASYLNVTVNNVAKVIGNESRLSQRIITQSTTGRNNITAPGKWTDTADGSEGRMKSRVKSTTVVEHHHNNVSERVSPEAMDTVVASQASLKKNLRTDKSRRMAGDGCVQGSAWYQQGIDSDEHAAVAGIASSKGLVVTAMTTPLAPYEAAGISNRGFEILCSAKNVTDPCCGSAASVRSVASIASGLLRGPPLITKRNGSAAPAGTDILDTKKEMGVSGVHSSPNATQGDAAAYSPAVLTMAEPAVIHGIKSTVDKLVMGGSAIPDWTDDQLAELFSDYAEADDMAINFRF